MATKDDDDEEGLEGKSFSKPPADLHFPSAPFFPPASGAPQPPPPPSRRLEEPVPLTRPSPKPSTAGFGDETERTAKVDLARLIRSIRPAHPKPPPPPSARAAEMPVSADKPTVRQVTSAPPPPRPPPPPTASETADTIAMETPPPSRVAPPPPSSRAAPPGREVGTAGEDLSQLTSWVAMLIIVSSLVMVLWNMQTRSTTNANTGSRYATIESLVDYGTYNIDASRYAFTPDKVKARGHWVSSKPPLLPTYGAGIYWVVKRITGYTIAEHEGIVVWTVGMFTGWLSHLVFLVYFYRLSLLLLRRQLAILVGMAAAAFAYLGTAYGTAINNHSVGAAFQVAGFYYAFRAGRGLGRGGSWLAAGLLLGLLPAFDLPSLAFTGFTGLYLLTKNWKRTFLIFLPALLPGLAAEVLLAHKATGSWLPAYADANLKNYAGNLFRQAKTGIEALREKKHIYAFHMLLGHHGLFSMTPIFFFSLYEFFRRLVMRDRHRGEILVWMATLAAFLAFYIRSTTNYGGWCVGMRWLVPVMPWLVMLFAMWLDRGRITRWKQGAVLVTFLVSAYHVQDGLSSPFQFSVWHNLLEGAPNRNRLGPTWNLARGPKPAKAKKAPPKPAAPAAPPVGAPLAPPIGAPFTPPPGAAPPAPGAPAAPPNPNAPAPGAPPPPGAPVPLRPPGAPPAPAVPPAPPR